MACEGGRTGGPELPGTSIGLESPQIIPACAHNPRTGHGGGNG